MLEFHDKRVHSLDNLLELRREVQAPESFAKRIQLLDALSQHGLPEFPALLDSVLESTSRPEITTLAERSNLLWRTIVSMPEFQSISKDRGLVERLYDRKRAYFERGLIQPRNLLIVFLTMFNNYFMSNIACLALARNVGTSVLLLKDPTPSSFLNGCADLGTFTMNELVMRLKSFIKNKQFNEVATTGFSSGGYAALFSAAALDLKGCLAIAPHTDFSVSSPLPKPRFLTRDIESSLAPPCRFNLKHYIKENGSNADIRVFYGMSSQKDTAHALNLESLKQVCITGVSGWGHSVISPLFTSGRLEAELRSFFN